MVQFQNILAKCSFLLKGLFCCVLRQDMLLSQGLSPTKSKTKWETGTVTWQC